MAGERPSPFTTVPHGFHYHYEEPKTPEREIVQFVQQQEVPVPAFRGFKIKRTRPRIDTGAISTRMTDAMAGFHDNPIPSIEISDREVDTDQTPRQPVAIHPRRLLTPLHQIAKTFPQTPMDRSLHRAHTPSKMETDTPMPARLASPLSDMSDSSDDSFIDSEDGFSCNDESLTSPDSDAADPFAWDSPTKAPIHSQQTFGSSPTPRKFAPKKCWTRDMDRHIWKVYQTYLNDPTVTPFKTLPGCPPPVGVCHRVAREARKSWKGGRTLSSQLQQLRQDYNQDTEIFSRPGGLFWPGGGSATRKRFRMLCKRKATIIPHYQRIIRSASPYLEGSEGRRGTNPISSSFPSTRDMTMSLATSTATTMRPDGPMAQMTNSESNWFNRPQAPWASPIPVPSDVETVGNSPVIERSQPIQTGAASITRLGSPFNGARTWGPSRSRNLERPRVVDVHDAVTTTDNIPRLRSPVHFQTVAAAPKPASMLSSTRFSQFQRSSQGKRPAQSDLEESLSNVDAEARRNRSEDVFASGLQDASQRLRNRGFTLGAHLLQSGSHVSEPATIAGPMPVNPARRANFSSLPPVGVYAIGIEDPFAPTSRPNPTPRLGSPFAGISARPSRSRRHVSSLSMPGAIADYESIDQRMDGV